MIIGIRPRQSGLTENGGQGWRGWRGYGGRGFENGDMMGHWVIRSGCKSSGDEIRTAAVRLGCENRDVV